MSGHSPITPIGWKLGQIVFFLITLLSLNGCFDEDNSDVAAALNEQNRLLQEQNQQAEASVELYGRVENIETDSLVDEFTAQIKIGPLLMDPITFKNGEFRLPNLKPDSNFALTISSASGEFVRRTLFGTTRNSSAVNVFQEVPLPIQVSPSLELEISVKDFDSDEPVKGLTFKGYSHIGNGSAFEDYAHVSTFDETLGVYKIQLPEKLNLSVWTELDLNRDGVSDFAPFEVGSVDGTRWIILNDTLTGNGDLFLSSVPNTNLTTLRLSVLDKNANPIPGLEIELDKDANAAPVYDADTGQYVFVTPLDSSLSILIPAFEMGGDYFASSYLEITKSSTENNYQINTSNANSKNYYTLTDDDLDLNLVISPKATKASTKLDLVYKTQEINPLNNIAKFFYSAPIAINETEAHLIEELALQVVRGNDSATDYVFPGTTSVVMKDLEIPVQASLSLGSTLLTLQTDVVLNPTSEYRYWVGEITDTTAQLDVDLSTDVVGFSVPSKEPFKVSDLKLDNDNFWTNGAIIRSTNTAGVASAINDQADSCHLYLPASIESLKNLAISKKVVNNRGSLSTKFGNYIIVEDGDLRVSVIYAVSSAYNENIVKSNVYSIYRGTSLADGKWYRTNVDEYCFDNTGSQPSTILFEYVYETADENVVTGEITLPVQ